MHSLMCPTNYWPSSCLALQFSNFHPFKEQRICVYVATDSVSLSYYIRFEVHLTALDNLDNYKVHEIRWPLIQMFIFKWTLAFLHCTYIFSFYLNSKRMAKAYFKYQAIKRNGIHKTLFSLKLLFLLHRFTLYSILIHFDSRLRSDSKYSV